MLKQLLSGITMLCAFATTGIAQQPAPAKPTFTIADVHDSPQHRFPFSNGFELSGNRYLVHQSTLVDLIAHAYDVDAEMVQGGPSWLEMKRFDVVAKADPATTPANLKLMLQALLADRFHLVLHKGEASMPAYLLTVPTGKSKMKPSTAGDDAPQQCNPVTNAETAGGVPLIVLSCTAMSTDQLAKFLHEAAGGYLTQPVVNQTSLEGKWDFTLKWTGRGQLTKAGADGISIFDAVDKQLGLKLDLKTAPRTVWIVDSVNDKPTPNSPAVANELPEPPPAQFEIATIRPSKPDEKPMGRFNGLQMSLVALSLKDLVTFAWELNSVDPNVLVNAPASLGDVKYDIIAKAPAPNLPPGSRQQPSIDNEEFEQMMRTLLTERFNMKVHMEDRPIDAFKLVADHPHMQAADPNSRTRCKQGPGPDGKDPRIANPAMNMLISCQNMTPKQMGEMFALYASGYVYSPALDATGLKGGYDFSLNWSSADQTILKSVPPAGGQQAPEFDTTMTFYDAVDKQLGLKLVKEKRPVPVLVIEHMDTTPAEN
jgi:uncharacterized protein (TIGR03435 family)